MSDSGSRQEEGVLIIPSDSAAVKIQKLLSSHRGFLIYAIYHITEKLTHYNESKLRAHDSRIVRDIENLLLRQGGLSQRQASGTNRLMNV